METHERDRGGITRHLEEHLAAKDCLVLGRAVGDGAVGCIGNGMDVWIWGAGCEYWHWVGNDGIWAKGYWHWAVGTEVLKGQGLV